MKLSRTIARLTLLVGLTACGGQTPTSAQQSSTTPPPPVQLAVFSDPASGTMTSDVHDVNEQTVQFDVNNSRLIWKLDGESFPGYTVSGAFINGQFQVRFGTKDGSCRALKKLHSQATFLMCTS